MAFRDLCSQTDEAASAEVADAASLSEGIKQTFDDLLQLHFPHQPDPPVRLRQHLEVSFFPRLCFFSTCLDLFQHVCFVCCLFVFYSMLRKAGRPVDV